MSWKYLQNEKTASDALKKLLKRPAQNVADIVKANLSLHFFFFLSSPEVITISKCVFLFYALTTYVCVCVSFSNLLLIFFHLIQCFLQDLARLLHLDLFFHVHMKMYLPVFVNF